MIKPVDPISDADLHGYLDDQLAMPRRIEVEDHLARHPDVAAQVMADLRTRDALRMAFPNPPSRARPDTAQAGRRLERGLLTGRRLGRLRRIAAVVVGLSAGWFAHAQFGAPSIGDSVASVAAPPYVDDAVMSHRTALVRAAMRSQPVGRHYDPDEIRSSTSIVLPDLPGGWRVQDVQIFPSKFGPSVEMAIATEHLGRLSLFAVRPGRFDVASAALAAKGDVTAAYWQIGEVAYALTGQADSREIERAAAGLQKTLY
jgi:anti-sigma factor RsiW